MKYDHRHPKIGDIVGCSDGDVGVVVSAGWRRIGITADNELVVEVAWSSGKTLTDPWGSKDFSSSKNMFWIMSRA